MSVYLYQGRTTSTSYFRLLNCINQWCFINDCSSPAFRISKCSQGVCNICFIRAGYHNNIVPWCLWTHLLFLVFTLEFTQSTVCCWKSTSHQKQSVECSNAHEWKKYMWYYATRAQDVMISTSSFQIIYTHPKENNINGCWKKNKSGSIVYIEAHVLFTAVAAWPCVKPLRRGSLGNEKKSLLKSCRDEENDRCPHLYLQNGLWWAFDVFLYASVCWSICCHSGLQQSEFLVKDSSGHSYYLVDGKSNLNYSVVLNSRYPNVSHPNLSVSRKSFQAGTKS